MFRTKDFILFLLVISFLILAIGVTVASRWSTDLTLHDSAITVDGEYSAEIYQPESISREDKLAEMRKKIADSEDLVVETDTSDMALVDDEPVLPDDLESSSTAAGIATTESETQRCEQYQIFAGSWDPIGVKFEIAEGARLIYKEVMQEVSVSTGTNTSATESITQKQILLQLPISKLPNALPACVQSDVIGIAQDGSLIRNNEAKLYSVFGQDTTIGYALDGFPIYGSGDLRPDVCGGVFTERGYGYYISSEREEVLHCFSGTPISI